MISFDPAPMTSC